MVLYTLSYRAYKRKIRYPSESVMGVAALQSYEEVGVTSRRNRVRSLLVGVRGYGSEVYIRGPFCGPR